MNSLISAKAILGEGTVTGPYCVIEDDVRIGAGCVIGTGVIIHQGSVIGDSVRIEDHTVIGRQPMRSPRSIFTEEKSYTPARIGDDCLIGSGVVIYVQCEIGTKNLIADLSTVREDVTIGDFNIIGRGVAIENFVTIGNRNKLETNVYITAYSSIADYCFVAPGVCTSNDNYMGRDPERYNHFKGVTLERGARLGVGCTVLPGVTVGEDGVAAAGALVTKDIPKRTIVAGVPAKFFREVPTSQLLENNLDQPVRK